MLAKIALGIGCFEQTANCACPFPGAPKSFFVSSFQPPTDRLKRSLNCEGVLDTACLQRRLYLTCEGATATPQTFSRTPAPVAPDNDDKTKSDAVGQEANFQFSFFSQRGSQTFNTSSPNWTSKLSKLTFEQSFQNALSRCLIASIDTSLLQQSKSQPIRSQCLRLGIATSIDLKSI